ncbi:hypothetical protein TNCT_623021 [Trichonephila clavata]|uniref:Uncharacterized protein n=1 Tax=Trichonephila clavata TaxID=2740835 RepID=A0A8X6FWZ7_TRICU|nr:hypothetical protein TNCT_623021 [Trichonephila clavata]
MSFSPNEPNEETRNRTSHLICQCFVFPPQINPLGTRRGNEKIPRPPSNPGSRDDHLEQQEKSSQEYRQVQCLDEVEEGVFQSNAVAHKTTDGITGQLRLEDVKLI